MTYAGPNTFQVVHKQTETGRVEMWVSEASYQISPASQEEATATTYTQHCGPHPVWS